MRRKKKQNRVQYNSPSASGVAPPATVPEYLFAVAAVSERVNSLSLSLSQDVHNLIRDDCFNTTNHGVSVGTRKRSKSAPREGSCSGEPDCVCLFAAEEAKPPRAYQPI